VANSVLKLLREHQGAGSTYHPLCSLLDLSGEADATVSDKINIHKSIAKYCEAELKSVEIKSNDLDGIKMSFNIGGSQ